MPNWCSTYLTVTGPREEVKDFLDGIQRETTDAGRTVLSISEGYAPTPQELRDTTATSVWETIPEHWTEALTKGEWTQEDYDKRVAENFSLLKKQQENIAKYGSKDWYDWQYENWGVKWGDVETEISSVDEGHISTTVFIEYKTPWGPMDKLWVVISKKFPKLLFHFYHEEEAGFFEGHSLLRNGEFLAEAFYEPCEYPGELDWDDGESVDKYDEWRETKRNECEDAIEKAKIAIREAV